MQQTILQTSTPTLASVLTITDTPTRAQLQVWWQAMRSDDLSVAYADSFPQTLTDFCLEVAQGDKLLQVCLLDGEVAGAVWLHDLQHRPDGTVAGGWIGAYFLPSHRGRLVIQVWQEVCQRWEAAGVRHFFTAINVANRRSQAMITRGVHFHLVGRFPQFTLFQGQAVDVFIYAFYTADTQLAWELASVRAARQMVGVASSMAG